MQVICTDGTVLDCHRFEAIDSGVLLFGEERAAPGEEEDESERREEAFGFVPIHSVRYVLPEGMLSARATSQPAPQQPTGGGGTQAPPPSGGQPGGPPQQSPGGAQPGPGQSSFGSGQDRRQ